MADFGEVDGQPVKLYTLDNGRGMVAKITNYGGIVTELHVPDRNNQTADVVLGFDTLEEYKAGHPFFGAIVGRCANRIAKGRFTLDGKEYQLATNNGPNHLHGGVIGFDKRIWDAEPLQLSDGPALKLTYVSHDGEEGYPGTLRTVVIYTLTTDNELKIDMHAETDAPTVVNLAHHGYWNLAGHASGTVLDQELQLQSDYYTPTDSTLIPTGEILMVDGTPHDFRQPKKLGRDIDQLKNDQGKGGYDTNFVVNGSYGELRPAARVSDPSSGRVMEVWTTEPGVQLYTANHLNDRAGKGGAVYGPHQGFCLETQKYPDAINHSNFVQPVLRPNQFYQHVMVHRFTTE